MLFEINFIKLKRNFFALIRTSFVLLNAISTIEAQIKFDLNAMFNIVFAIIE